MQLIDRVKNCNGCGACVVACKEGWVKMVESPLGEGHKLQPQVNEAGCNRCNACMLWCPVYNPVELPYFEEFYEYNDEFSKRDMPQVYCQTKRSVRTGSHTEFVGTLCEIAALKSLSADQLKPNLIVRPLWCDEEKRAKEPGCQACEFYKQYQSEEK